MGYSNPGCYSLIIHDDAYDDLDSIFNENEDAAAALVVLLELLETNQDLLDRLTQRKFVNYGTPHFNVDEWQETRKTKYNLWRIRELSSAEAGGYRIVYAYHPQEFKYYVLAILRREFVYDSTNPRVARIFEIYDANNIPRY